jgi:hypothetical protein
MDEQSKATLDAILANEPAALTEADIAFLRARRSYLTEEQKAVYAEVLSEELESNDEVEKKGYEPMNKSQLQTELTARNISFQQGASKAALVALLEQSDSEVAAVKSDETVLNQ